MPGNLEFPSGIPANPNLVAAALTVEMAVVFAEQLFYFADLHRGLPPRDGKSIARANTCVKKKEVIVHERQMHRRPRAQV